MENEKGKSASFDDIISDLECQEKNIVALIDKYRETAETVANILIDRCEGGRFYFNSNLYIERDGDGKLTLTEKSEDSDGLTLPLFKNTLPSDMRYMLLSMRCIMEHYGK